MCKEPNSVRISPLKPTPTFNNHYGDMVDACMASFLQKLADDGFITVFSCCGHGTHGPYLTALFDCSTSHIQFQQMISRLEAENWIDIRWEKTNYGLNMERFSFYGEWNNVVPSDTKERKVTCG